MHTMHRQNLYNEEREENLLRKAVNLLQDMTGLRVDIQRQEERLEQLDLLYRIDAYGYLRIGEVDTPLIIEVKRHPTKAVVGAIAQQFKQYPEKGLLVADYINPMMADRLKELDIWFLDTMGNAYINAPPVFVYVKGNKQKQLMGKKKKRRAFQPTGLKVIFALLCNPELVNAPYRDIAHAADVAHGTVGWVVTDLKELGYLVEMGKKGRRLKGLKKLFERWVEAYPDQLRPKILIGKFTTNEPTWWKDTDFDKFNAYVGGEIAADYLTHYLIPKIKTLYIREKPEDLQLAFGMRKDPNGDIELLETFWNVECNWVGDNGMVNPMLIYADLLATGDPRNIETAEMVYEKEIARHLREN